MRFILKFVVIKRNINEKSRKETEGVYFDVNILYIIHISKKYNQYQCAIILSHESHYPASFPLLRPHTIHCDILSHIKLNKSNCTIRPNNSQTDGQTKRFRTHRVKYLFIYDIMENTIGLCLINIINSISGKYKKKTSFVIVKYACM